MISFAVPPEDHVTPLPAMLSTHWSTAHIEADLQGDAKEAVIGAEEPQVDRRAREGNAPDAPRLDPFAYVRSKSRSTDLFEPWCAIASHRSIVDDHDLEDWIRLRDADLIAAPTNRCIEAWNDRRNGGQPGHGDRASGRVIVSFARINFARDDGKREISSERPIGIAALSHGSKRKASEQVVVTSACCWHHVACFLV